MGGSPSELSEELVTQEKRKMGWRMICDVGEATEGLKNELWRRWSDGKIGEWALLIKWRAYDVGEAKEGYENEL